MYSNDSPQYETPERNGPPGRGSENRQLQWIMRSVEALHAGQQDLLRNLEKLDTKVEKLDTKVEMKQKGCAESFGKERELMLEKHTRLEDRISSTHSLLEARIDNAFQQTTIKISEFKTEIFKWVNRVGMTLLIAIVCAAIKYIIFSDF